MFFPIRSDIQLKHTPWMNYSLIAINVLVFLLTLQYQGPHMASLNSYFIQPGDLALSQFISYQFLHQGWQHLFGNMVFLYVFGASVENRFGKVGYLAFYLTGGIVAAFGHLTVSQAPMLGASGAVASVTGAYLLLFPMSNITIAYWFLFYIGKFEVSGLVLILFQIGTNIVMLLAVGSGVAYMAHIGGYVLGITVATALLAVHLLPREPYDLLSLIEHRRRRSQFRRMNQRGYKPWEHTQASSKDAKQAGSTTQLTDQENQLALARQQITTAVDQRDLPSAALLYESLLQKNPDQLFTEQPQLDIANQLMSLGHYDTAAAAYELFLDRYRTYHQREQVQLILGLIYVKYLDKPEQGKQVLALALPRLNDPQQQQLAQDMLDNKDVL